MKRLLEKIKSGLVRFFRIFDLEDIMTAISLSLIFYGLYLYRPMIAYTVVGFILLFIARGAGRKN